MVYKAQDRNSGQAYNPDGVYGRRQFIRDAATAFAGVNVLLGARSAKAQGHDLEQIALELGMPLAQLQSIDRYMNQPVRETLSGLKETTPSNFGINVDSTSRPVMLFVFYDPSSEAGVNRSRGYAAVYRALSEDPNLTSPQRRTDFQIYDFGKWEVPGINGSPAPNKGFIWTNSYNPRMAGADSDREARVTEVPSVVMYSDLDSFDLGRRDMRAIDVLQGGFTTIAEYKNGLDVSAKWIKENVINPGRRVFPRFGNHQPPARLMRPV